MHQIQIIFNIKMEEQDVDIMVNIVVISIPISNSVPPRAVSNYDITIVYMLLCMEIEGKTV
jgi:hypothetical protein